MRQLEKIAVIRSDFPEKFGIPRQSGIIEELKAEIIFEPPYRDPNCVMGLEDFSHIWLIWEFSGNLEAGWSPTVIPPRLGGRIHKGVFATRSPFRPNPVGLSCVKLDGIEMRQGTGPVLHVSGADLRDGTPVYDIKPYIRYTDCHPDAVSGFADEVKDYRLEADGRMPAVACGEGEMDYGGLMQFARARDLSMTLENTIPENAERAKAFLLQS